MCGALDNRVVRLVRDYDKEGLCVAFFHRLLTKVVEGRPAVVIVEDDCLTGKGWVHSSPQALSRLVSQRGEIGNQDYEAQLAKFLDVLTPLPKKILDSAQYSPRDVLLVLLLLRLAEASRRGSVLKLRVNLGKTGYNVK